MYSTSFPCSITPIIKLSVVVIFKFKKLKECPSRDIAAYPKFILCLQLYEGPLYYIRLNYDPITYIMC